MSLAVSREGTADKARLEWSLLPSGDYADHVTPQDVQPWNGSLILVEGMRCNPMYSAHLNSHYNYVSLDCENVNVFYGQICCVW